MPACHWTRSTTFRNHSLVKPSLLILICLVLLDTKGFASKWLEEEGDHPTERVVWETADTKAQILVVVVHNPWDGQADDASPDGGARVSVYESEHIVEERCSFGVDEAHWDGREQQRCGFI